MKEIVWATFGFAALVFFAPMLGVLGGSFSGWVVAFFGFEPVVLGFLHRLGLNTDGLPLWQVGAAMGFLGGFLKTNSSSTSSSK